jgi:hypothetical protein
MPYAVLRTTLADRQVRGLRGARAAAFERFELALAHQGCAALGYRLTGTDPLPRLCVKHLRGLDRVVVAFTEDEAWVLLVGPHDAEDAVRDIYLALYELAGVVPPEQPRTKPPCCDDVGAPPVLDERAVEDLIERVRMLRR